MSLTPQEEAIKEVKEWWPRLNRDLQHKLFAKYYDQFLQGTTFEDLLWSDVFKIYVEETLNDMPVEKLYKATKHIEYMFRSYTN